MTIESMIAALTTATTSLLTAVGVQQTSIANAVAAFAAVIIRVNSGLNKVDNTTDAEKPVSALTQTALNAKQATLVSGANLSTINGFSLLGGEPLVIQRSATSINKLAYDDRALLRGLTPQVDDSTVVRNLGLFQWIDNKDEPDDDETCFNTATGQWLLQAPAWDLIDAWNSLDQSILDDWMEDEPIRFAAYVLANK